MPKPALIAVVVLIFGGLVAALVFSQLQPVPLRVSGFVEADQIRVGSRVGGRVAKVLVTEGQPVTAGAILVQLEPYDLLAQKSRAQAQRDAAKSNLARLVAGLLPEEVAQQQANREELAARLAELEAGPRKEEIATSEARVKQATARLALARANYKRQLQLAENSLVSQAAMDVATENLNDAESALEVRRQELTLLRLGTRDEVIRAARASLARADAALALARRGFREEDIAQARALLAVSEADLARIEVQIRELEVRAPVDGTIEAIDLQPGDLVTPNSPVLSLIDTRQLWLRAYLPENRLGFPNGHKVEVTVDSFPDRVFHGALTFISRNAEFTPQNVQTPEERSKQVFRIKVTLEDGSPTLRPGMAADIWLEPRIR